MSVEFGDHYDNIEVLYFALLTIERGDREQGLAIIRELRNHIVQVDETKSREWLLPKIESLEREIGRDPGTSSHSLNQILAIRSVL